MTQQCKKIVESFPRYKLNKLSPEKRFDLFQQSIDLNILEYDSKWHQTLVAHHYKDIKKINQRKTKQPILPGAIHRVYYIKINKTEYHKIGITSNPGSAEQALHKRFPDGGFEIIGTIECESRNKAKEIEKGIKRKYNTFLIEKSDLILKNGYTETFYIDVSTIKIPNHNKNLLKLKAKK